MEEGGDAGQREEGRRMLQIADEKPSEAADHRFIMTA